MKNTGYEVQITGVPVYTRDVRIDLSLALSHTSNEIVDMGGTDNLTGRHQPVPSGGISGGRVLREEGPERGSRCERPADQHHVRRG